jgi:DNA repair exonuclease SbcCD ATPase subunit
MRRAVFLTLGVLECLIATGLAILGWQLPGQADIDRTFGRAERVTQNASEQVRRFRTQVHDLRRPELEELARQLQGQSRTVTATLRSQNIDFDQVKTVSTALGDVATGLDGLAETLDPATIGKVGEGFGATADFLDRKVAPEAGKAAAGLEKSLGALREDAQRLSELLRQAPPDLRAAREIHDSLARFGEGLDRLHALLKIERLTTMREGFRGLQTSLTSGAQQVERLSSYHYPVVTFRGLKPEVEQRKFWPEGDRIADGMRKAADGAKAANEEMAALEADLPALRTSLEESRKMTERTREALAVALKQQDKVEALLKSVPEHTARLAEELPRLGADMARILRDTQKLTEVAAVLRQAQKGVDTAVARWPQLRTSLGRSADLLRAMQQQLDRAVEHRQEYEAALKQTIVLADTFATVLPLFIESLQRQLYEQEQGLDALGQSLDDVGEALPAYAATTSTLVGTARLLAWLVAATVGLHGAYLLLGQRLGASYGA